jgi:UDP-2,3-diacylglucosamine pyrophosphatase LpxH
MLRGKNVPAGSRGHLHHHSYLPLSTSLSIKKRTAESQWNSESWKTNREEGKTRLAQNNGK